MVHPYTVSFFSFTISVLQIGQLLGMEVILPFLVSTSTFARLFLRIIFVVVAVVLAIFDFNRFFPLLLVVLFFGAVFYIISAVESYKERDKMEDWKKGLSPEERKYWKLFRRRGGRGSRN